MLKNLPPQVDFARSHRSSVKMHMRVTIIKRMHSHQDGGNERKSISYFNFFVKFRFYRSIETLYANVFCLYGLFLHACFCRDEGNPTYRFLLNQKALGVTNA